MMKNNKTNDEKLAEVEQILSVVIGRQEHTGLTMNDKREMISTVYRMYSDALVFNGGVK